MTDLEIATPPPSWKRFVTLAVTFAILLLGAWVISARWGELSVATRTIGLPRVIAAVVVSSASIIVTGECWRRWLEALAPGLTLFTAHRIFYATQAGKYVPGGVWPVVGQLALARRFGVPRSAMLGATSLFLATHLTTGVALGVFAFRGQGPEWLWLTLPVVFLGLAALSPPIIRRAGGALLRRIASHTEMPSAGASTTGSTALLMVIAWIGYGCATQILLSAFGIGLFDLPLVIGAFALSWVVGFVAFLAPAGIGAREAAFVALLSPTVGLTPALAAALLSRIAVTIGDVVLGAVSASVVGGAATPSTPPTEL